MSSFEEKIKAREICGRLLDNEPHPMKGCNFVDCDKCKLNVTYFIPTEDVLAEIHALHEKILKLRSITTSPMSYNDWIERKKVLALITTATEEGERPEVAKELLKRFAIGEGRKLAEITEEGRTRKMKFLSRFRKPKLKLYELKNILPPQRHGKSRHLRVLAINEEEAFAMRQYLKYEGFED